MGALRRIRSWSLRDCLIAALVLCVLIPPLAYFVSPGVVTSKSLAYSVTMDVDGSVPADPRCSRAEQAGEWRCYTPRYDSEVSGIFGATYRVEVNWIGCWEATRIRGRAKDAFPDRAEGCVKLKDNVRFLDRLLN